MTARQLTRPAPRLTPDQQRDVDCASALVTAHDGGQETLTAFIEQRYDPDFGDQYAYALGLTVAELKRALAIIADLTGDAS